MYDAPAPAPEESRPAGGRVPVAADPARNIVFLGEKGNGEVSIHFKVKMPNCLPPDLDDELRKIRHVEDAQIQ